MTDETEFRLPETIPILPLQDGVAFPYGLILSP